MPIDTKQAGPALTIAPSDPSGAGALEGAELSELPARDAQALLARLEPLPDVSAHPAPPLRAPSAAPPRSGAVQPIAFAVPAGKPVGDAPIAAVARVLAPPQITPQGDVLGDAEVQIRFSEPMVPVAALGEVTAPPAEIAPRVAGTWRWVDTRLLSFRAEAPGLPRSTSYVVRVPAGTKALNGATLPQIAEARFTMSSVSLLGAFPSSPLRPDSAVALAFDQRVDPAHIAKMVRIARRGGPPIPFHVIPLDEARARWQRNPALVAAAPTWPTRHQVLIAPDTAWPAGAELQVTLPANTRSLEGPNITTEARRATFDVVPAFAVRGVSCDFGPPSKRARCSANGYMQLRFTNKVQEASYRSSKVQLANRPFEDHLLNGNTVSMSAPNGQGSYEIAIGDGLIDIYDQPLVGPQRIAFSTTAERHEPLLEAPRGLIVLDPRFQIPQWVVYGQAISSMRIQLFAVQPADYFAFSEYAAGDRAKPPGKRIYDHTFSVGARHGANARVDLRPALNAAGLGHVVAIATAVPAASRTPEQFERTLVAWIQVSKLGLAARIDGERAHAWVHRIATDRDLAPLAGVTTSLLVEKRGAGPAVTTADDGHATLELPPRVERKPTDDVPSALLLASSGDDSTFAPFVGDHERAIRSADARWYVTDDRFTYRPGEKLYVKGWVRWSTGGVNPDLELPAVGEQLAYALDDARGNRLASGTTQLTERGGFDLAIDLPSNANLGTAMLALSTRQRSYRHPIAIQEFRTPAYAVTLNDDVTHAGAVPLVLGESIEMAVEAKYYAGGGLPGADLAWSASLTAASYRPPGWAPFWFSPVPHYLERRDLAVRAEAQTALSATSRARAVLGIAALPRDRPSLLSVDATITDVDRQRIRASSRQILVHPASYYVGVRARPRGHELEVVVTDVDGKPVAGVPISVDVNGALASERHRKDAQSADQQRCQLVSGEAPVVCTWQPRKGFVYLAIATIQDSRGRTNRARYELPFYVADRNADLAVIAERTSYRAGEVAKLEIQSKTFPATAIVSFARNGVIAQQRVELAGESTTLELPIEERYLENVHVLVDRWARRADRQDSSNAPLPELRSAALDLRVDLDSARLEVTTRPRTPRVAPGAKATFEVEVKRAGQPVAGAEVALLVVDEAVLALSGRSHPDPVAPFFEHIEPGAFLRDTVSLIENASADLDGGPGFSRFSLDSGMRHIGYGGGRGTGGGLGGGAAGSAGSTAIAARKDFRPTAVFSPRLRTDARGKVALTVDMPESLTRFRVVALAAAQTRYFGRAESTIATQRTVNARTVAPRFLTQGDSFALPVVVQNLDTTPRTVDVAVRAANLQTTGPIGQRVTLAPGQRAELRFSLATVERGRAVVQTVASSGDFADATNIEIPVYEPATTESFATYGVVDDAATFERLVVPADLFPSVGGVEVELAATQLQELTDAYWYLYAYPYECAEQRSSRMLATAALYDILDAFATPGRPDRKQIEATLAEDVRRLTKDQRKDGGWGYFGGMESEPFVTAQVLAALAASKASGPVVQRARATVTDQVNALLAQLERRAALPAASRRDRGKTAYQVSLAASSLAILGALGDVRGLATRLHAAAVALGDYPLDAKAQVLGVLAKSPGAAAIRSRLLADLVGATRESAGVATVAASYLPAERWLLVSEPKTTALVLDALLREDPGHALIPKLARGVLQTRRHGRWRSTQENMVVLGALRRYFDVYEKATPSFTGKLWMGDAGYAEHAFAGRTSTRATAQLPWTALRPGSSHDLALVKAGTGRMYYRVGITYAPKRSDLPALDAGFVVRRTYTPIDDPSDVEVRDGRTQIRLGARVRVALEVTNTAERYGVVLVDPLPAGLEPINNALATSEREATAPDGDRRWDHRNLRDNRGEAFAMELPAGVHRFSYTARATTPGTFLAAPAKAEEMYAPETFGRTTGQTVVIE